MYLPNGTVITDGDVDNATAYCYDRGDGQFTRLVPVDLLPFALKDIPARVAGDEDMIVLPVPRKTGADGQPQSAGGQLLPTSTSTSRIDSIVANAPPSGGPIVLCRSNGSAAMNTVTGPYGKREKIYCDKWIHDGTCAFTQQGCKFKHEMPQDKETQQSLGLFHGYPAWWKKHCAEQQMQIDDRPINIGGAFPVNGNNGSGNVVNNTRAGDGVMASSNRFGAATTTTAATTAPTWRRLEAASLGEQHSVSIRGSGPGAGAGGRSAFHNRGRGSNGQNQIGASIARFDSSNLNYGPIAPPNKRIAFKNDGDSSDHSSNPASSPSTSTSSKGGAPLST
ncbi:hypothetical protein BD289DRAFT_475472 [Coniella lustricola]|uniref:C3H1-type domain-containing protein n=1 Tax=Coniella lustricola TaxID=2025994 RepID=A0A2T3A2T6_9PEZI|nr:hypothetical protein BD289DRAFT_475472 [Coniella lustricola]